MFVVARGRTPTDSAAMMRGWESRLRNALAGLMIVVCLPAALAVAQGGVEACVALDEDIERLACYDALFRNTGALPEGAIVLESERLIPASPTGREPATMTLSCEGEAVRVSFGFAGQLVSNTGDIAPLTYQVDAGGTTVRTLRASADNRQLSFSNGTDTANFLDPWWGHEPQGAHDAGPAAIVDRRFPAARGC